MMISRVTDKLGVPFVQFIVYALVIGIAWGTLKMEVSQKVDKQTLIESEIRLSRLDAQQMAKFDEVANDIKVIKAILCSQATKDSFCKVIR